MLLLAVPFFFNESYSLPQDPILIGKAPYSVAADLPGRWVLGFKRFRVQGTGFGV